MRDRTVIFAYTRTAGYWIFAAVAAFLAGNAVCLWPIPPAVLFTHPVFWSGVVAAGVLAGVGELGVRS